MEEWKYWQVDMSNKGSPSSFIYVDMAITSAARCDALVYFKHEDDGFTTLPTHYDFQHFSDSRSFYAYGTLLCPLLSA